MKTRLILYLFLAILISCTNDDPKECIGYRNEYVTEVNAPSSGKINEAVEIEIDFVVNNGCGNFEKFLESGSEQSKTIEVQAKYEGCICPQVTRTITAVYEFIPLSTGEYELKFKSGETEFTTVNLIITE
ncbi:hypothetical protein [Gillisia limnaea]|uniref:Lipoprotein n=1 Tax=Gillisia limnaea (strain DSM 15749 / LMG 21470 / R-8282) TaxID=865937 RepID=H2BXX7_GILLR|nr:hypothetical protein [Gillisia limnaea]EHQ02140.1 hypothetical protein Gilli_1487 [Gillisia limnaea DSM 15749]